MVEVLRDDGLRRNIRRAKNLREKNTSATTLTMGYEEVKPTSGMELRRWPMHHAEINATFNTDSASALREKLTVATLSS